MSEVKSSNEQLIQRLRDCAQAYPEDVFSPLSKEEVERLQSNKRHLLDRASAAMGRHFSPLFTDAADEIERLTAELEYMAAMRDKAVQNRHLCERAMECGRLRAALELSLAWYMDDKEGECWKPGAPDGVWNRQFNAAATAAYKALRGADTSTAALGPREPDNSMVICPNCTCQFGAISVNDQAERRRLERVERAWHFVQNCPQDEPLRNALQQAFMRDFKGSSPDEPSA